MRKRAIHPQVSHCSEDKFAFIIWGEPNLIEHEVHPPPFRIEDEEWFPTPLLILAFIRYDINYNETGVNEIQPHYCMICGAIMGL